MDWPKGQCNIWNVIGVAQAQRGRLHRTVTAEQTLPREDTGSPQGAGRGRIHIWDRRRDHTYGTQPNTSYTSIRALGLASDAPQRPTAGGVRRNSQGSLKWGTRLEQKAHVSVPKKGVAQQADTRAGTSVLPAS
ncbi:hypothetical protein PO909_016725 [Leuciscus waleckii]